MGRSVKARFFIMDIRLSLCLDEFLEAGLIVPIDPIRGQFRDLVDEDPCKEIPHLFISCIKVVRSHNGFKGICQDGRIVTATHVTFPSAKEEIVSNGKVLSQFRQGLFANKECPKLGKRSFIHLRVGKVQMGTDNKAENGITQNSRRWLNSGTTFSLHS